ncbi:MAG: ATP-binding protein, partial [Nitrospinota bacterium]
KLAKANEEIKGFANIVSHDLRSPLVNIKGFSEELKSSCRKLTGILSEASPRLTREQNKLIREVMKEEIPEAFGFIDSSANAMEKLVSSIMALARIGVRKMIPVEVDVAGLINEKLRSMHHQVEDKNVDVKVNSLPSVVADLMSLDQIFGNIFSNSIKYLDPGRPGVIEISGERRSGDTLYKVEDNGIGIPDYGKDKVFVLFRRVVGKDIPGEGMGLAYVKALVERHDGEIWFESQEGKGTTVFFTIPDDIMTLGETNGKS